MDIKDLLAEEWEVKISHVYREQNSVTDWLAKKALKYGWGETEICVVPVECHEHVVADMEGIPLIL